MSLFNKKSTVAFADVLKGLQQAVSSVASMLQSQQVQNLSNFWKEDGRPVTQKVSVGDKNMEVPIIALVSHSNLAMDDVEIKFKTRIGEVSQSALSGLGFGESVSHADLQTSVSGVKADADDVMEVTIRFKMKETPEGVSRLLDEYNKHI